VTVGTSVRLVVANGCSFSYGVDLREPGVSCWGRVLADHLGAAFVNLAAGGGGNRRLVRTTVEQLAPLAAARGCQPEQVLFLGMWTELPRWEVYDPAEPEHVAVAESFRDRPWHRIGPWSLDRRYRPAQHYYRYLQHDEADFLNFLLGYVLLESYLRQRGFRHGFCLVEGFPQLAGDTAGCADYLADIDEQHLLGGWRRCGELSFVEVIRDRALPMSGRRRGVGRGNGHPLEQAHRVYALDYLAPFTRSLLTD
jgi:Family of unknown function (DUF6071)